MKIKTVEKVFLSSRIRFGIFLIRQKFSALILKQVQNGHIFNVFTQFQITT